MKIKKILILLLAVFLIMPCSFAVGTAITNTTQATDMPFYDLQPKETVFRARFYTSYTNSSMERKSNINLAVKSLNNVLIAPNEEFSFNQTVGARTESRGYKTAKIIFDGKFIDGVGGGVCQVSTTLYNAALLSGMQITEYHAHSLPVSYIAPSFDAMVNSATADLRFINPTHNPVIIKAVADGNVLSVEIYGEPMQEKYVRESVIVQEISPPKEEIVYDDNNEYPDLFEGESRVISYGKKGYKSQAVLKKVVNGKTVWTKVIRKDGYAPTRGIIMMGKAKRLEEQGI